MKYKIGDKVSVRDRSYSFGVNGGKYSPYIPYDTKENFTIVETDLNTMRDANGQRDGKYFEQCDLLITDGQGNFWFVQSENCESANLEIEVRYHLLMVRM